MGSSIKAVKNQRDSHITSRLGGISLNCIQDVTVKFTLISATSKTPQELTIPGGVRQILHDGMGVGNGNAMVPLVILQAWLLLLSTMTFHGVFLWAPHGFLANPSLQTKWGKQNVLKESGLGRLQFVGSLGSIGRMKIRSWEMGERRSVAILR